MRFPRAVRILALLLTPAFFYGPSRTWATPEQDFQNTAQTDYQAITDYLNGQFAKSMGFFCGLGWNTPTQVFDFFTGPRFELGVGVGADLVGFPKLSSLGLGAIDQKTNISLPGVLPAPFPVITGRVGLLRGLDVGVKFNYLPLVNLPDLGFSADYFGWGLDLRYKLLEGVYDPTLTVGISFDTMKGGLRIYTPINQSGTYDDAGTPYTVSFSGSNTYSLAWETKSFGAQVQIGKDLGMLFPFAAVGFQRNSGTITSSMTGIGTLNVSGSGTSPANLNLTGVSASQPALFEPKFVLGFDMGIGLHWGAVAESNGTDIAGSTSFRVQF